MTEAAAICEMLSPNGRSAQVSLTCRLISEGRNSGKIIHPQVRLTDKVA